MLHAVTAWLTSTKQMFHHDFQQAHRTPSKLSNRGLSATARCDGKPRTSLYYSKPPVSFGGNERCEACHGPKPSLSTMGADARDAGKRVFHFSRSATRTCNELRGTITSTPRSFSPLGSTF
mmetsp:Transcript_30480/g.71101  ORF Transcript_30480/g.71101 Transcript_30480/m.71101 type:complete len:121 (+) Transcript_30480:54-416(+)